MAFRVSLKELEQAEQDILNVEKRPRLLPVDPSTGRARYLARLTACEDGVWSKGSIYKEFAFQVIEPAWVDTTGQPSTEEEGGLWVEGMRIGERVTLVDQVTRWKIPQMLVGFKEWMIDNGYSEEVDGETYASIELDEMSALTGAPPVVITVRRKEGQEKIRLNAETGAEETYKDEQREIAGTLSGSTWR